MPNGDSVDFCEEPGEELKVLNPPQEEDLLPNQNEEVANNHSNSSSRKSRMARMARGFTVDLGSVDKTDSSNDEGKTSWRGWRKSVTRSFRNGTRGGSFLGLGDLGRR